MLFGPQHDKTCLLGFANNKGADQPAHSLFAYWKVSYLDLLKAKFQFSS